MRVNDYNRPAEINTYNVVNGLLDGGFPAETISGKKEADGWYYLLDDADYGVGPYLTSAEAQDAGYDEIDDRRSMADLDYEDDLRRHQESYYENEDPYDYWNERDDY